MHYHPAGPGIGVAHLGFTRRTYFENPEVGAPTDTAREAAWWSLVHADPSDDHRLRKQAEIVTYLATDDAPAPDGDVFVEFTTARLIAALGLPPAPFP